MRLRFPCAGRLTAAVALAAALLCPTAALAKSEADIVLPDLSSQTFFGVSGQQLLTQPSHNN